MSSLHDELTQPTLEQAVKNHIKVVRAAIRLKHTLDADTELANTLPLVRAELAKQMQNGKVTGISFADMLRLVGGEES